MRLTGRHAGLYGMPVFRFQPAGAVEASPADGVAADITGMASRYSYSSTTGVTSSGNLTDTGDPRGKYSSVAAVMSGHRYYFGAGGEEQFRIGVDEDFTCSVLCTSHWTTDRAYTMGNSQSNGGVGTMAFGSSSGGGRIISVAGGNGTFNGGSAISFFGPTNIVKNNRMRYDFCRVGGRCYAFFDGLYSTSNVGAYVPGSLIGGGKWSVGGVGEYQTSNGGAYGDRWKGPVEQVVLLKGVGLFTAPFDASDPRPFQRGRLRR